jgi:hypothetical protein
MWLLLAVVAGAAAVLSFSALRQLGELCGFAPALAPLLPVTIDAGAAAGCLVWLGQLGAGAARGYARALTLALLMVSVTGNAVAHWLTAEHRVPSWVLVVAVSAVAPGVLGAVVHLGALLHRGPGESNDPGEDEDAAQAATARPESPVDGLNPPGEGDGPGDADGQEPDRAAELIQAGAGRRTLARELGVSEHAARQLLAGRTNGAGR